MGNSRFDAGTYSSYASSKAHLDHTTRYTRSSVAPTMDPKMIKVRESVKSDANPKPTPIIVALDVTGSMGPVVEAMHKGLGTLFKEVIDRNPVSDPHVLGMGVGDMSCDRSPVQATQFEADPVVIGQQLDELHLERGGGGNSHESYLGPLYFALMRTKCDAFSEGRKGYLFTVGDEQPQMVLSTDEMKRWFGDGDATDLTAEQLIESVGRNWHYFHLIVTEGDHMQSPSSAKLVREKWRKLLGQRCIDLTDHTKMAEVVISLIEVTEGRDKQDVVASWSGSTAVAVRDAVRDLAAAGKASAGPVAL